MVYGKLGRKMPSTHEEWKKVSTVGNEAMQQALAIFLGYPDYWRVCRDPRSTGQLDYVYNTKDDESGLDVPVGGPVAAYEVGDDVEVLEPAVKPDCAKDDIKMALSVRVQDMQWYKATIVEKSEYLDDIRYKVYYPGDDTFESNVWESKMRPTIVYDDEDDLIIDIVPIMTAYNAKKASKGSRTPTKRKTSKRASPSKSGRHAPRRVTPTKLDGGRAKRAKKEERERRLQGILLTVSPGRLGLTLTMLAEGGAEVTRVDPACTFRGQICVGDRIVTVDGRLVQKLTDLAVGNERVRKFGVVKREMLEEER